MGGDDVDGPDGMKEDSLACKAAVPFAHARTAPIDARNGFHCERAQVV